MIDSHCHLNYDYGTRSPDDLLRDARAAGVSAVINVGTGPDSIEPCEKLSERHPDVYHTVGIHPHEAGKMTAQDLDRFRRAVNHPGCRGIGELGLDYFYRHSDPGEQRRCLESQLDLARETRLPVVIHGRDAEADLLPMLLDHAKHLPSDRIPGVLHCFTGSVEFGRACIDAGFYVSFSGMLTFKNAASLQDAARIFPIDRLLVETDAPFLAPIPFRGKRCEPSMVVWTARKLAELRGMTEQEIDRITTENTLRLFKIKTG